MAQAKKVLIIGAGFGGIAAALELSRKRYPKIEVTLISDRPHFEFTPSLYRVVTGRSPLEVCVPIRDIIGEKKINFTQDHIIRLDPRTKMAVAASGNQYNFDFALLAFGSETSHYNIPGLKEFSLGFKSITDAIKLKHHIHELFSKCTVSAGNTFDNVCRMHFVIAGAGPSGVELAGELAEYTAKLAKAHGVDQNLIGIDLFEAAPRILPGIKSERMVHKIEMRLRKLNINIFTNRAMLKEVSDQAELQGITLKSDTIIWTAGIQPNSLYKDIAGFEFDKKGRVLVDDFLQASGLEGIFVAGDGASTKYAGLAQTAILEGKVAGANILRLVLGKSLKKYRPREPFYFIPVGKRWSASDLRFVTLYGLFGWLLRRAADFHYFLSILPTRKAFKAFWSSETLCESCEICSAQ